IRLRWVRIGSSRSGKSPRNSATACRTKQATAPSPRRRRSRGSKRPSGCRGKTRTFHGVTMTDGTWTEVTPPEGLQRFHTARRREATIGRIEIGVTVFEDGKTGHLSALELVRESDGTL